MKIYFLEIPFCQCLYLKFGFKSLMNIGLGIRVWKGCKIRGKSFWSCHFSTAKCLTNVETIVCYKIWMAKRILRILVCYLQKYKTITQFILEFFLRFCEQAIWINTKWLHKHYMITQAYYHVPIWQDWDFFSYSLTITKGYSSPPHTPTKTCIHYAPGHVTLQTKNHTIWVDYTKPVVTGIHPKLSK